MGTACEQLENFWTSGPGCLSNWLKMSKLSSIIRLSKNLSVLRRCPQPAQINRIAIRPISTTKKDKDSVTLKQDLENQNSNWVSWGFSYTTKEEDSTFMHILFFTLVTLCMVTGGYVWTYAPDTKLRDWAQREAFLEIRRREAEGLPHIDANLIDPENFELPSDEELEDTEIII